MATETTGPEPEETGGEAAPEQPSRIAGAVVTLILAAVALLILRAVVTAAPYVAYFVAGVLACLGWQKARGWLARRRTPAAEEEEEQDAEQPDVGEALRRLVGDDNGVLLTRLRDELKVADTKVVKQVLDDAGVSWKAVRTRAGNGPGVHVKDIPAAPSPAPSDAHGEGCCCRSGDNANSDNTGEEGRREGVRVVRNQTGVTIYDLADTHRRHKVIGK